MDGGESRVEEVGGKPCGEDLDAYNEEDEEEKNGLSS